MEILIQKRDKGTVLVLIDSRMRLAMSDEEALELSIALRDAVQGEPPVRSSVALADDVRV